MFEMFKYIKYRLRFLYGKDFFDVNWIFKD